MFGKKKPQSKKPTEQAPAALDQAHVQVMPEAFYGGKDPVIFAKHKPKKAQPAAAPIKPVAKPAAPKPPTTPQHKTPAAPMAPPKKSRVGMIILIILLLAVIIGGVLWWFVFRSEPTPAPTTDPIGIIPFEEPEPVVPTPVEPVIPTPPPVVPTSTAPEPVVPDRTAIRFPQMISVDSVDVDADSLTDEEERIFGTDPTIWDSDGDTFYDGQEIVNLYNPRGEAPVRLIDSGLVREYTNPQWRYRLYHPINWELGRIDTEGRHVIFSSISGEYVEVRVFEKSPAASFQDWFADTIAGERFNDLQPLTNRFDVVGHERRDGLVAYFPTETEVVVFVYVTPEVTTEIRYRNLMKMMVQSYRSGAIRPGSVSLPPITQPASTPTTTEPAAAALPPQVGSGIPGLDSVAQ